MSLVCDRFQRVTQCRCFVSQLFVRRDRESRGVRCAHTMENEHARSLSKVCRIGGRRFSTLSRSTTYLAGDYVEELKGCFGVSVQDDVEGVHPPSICVICRQVVSRFRKAVASGRTDYALRGGGCGEIQEWSPHCTNCLVCSPPSEPQSIRGRPQKKKKINLVKYTQESSPSPIHVTPVDQPAAAAEESQPSAPVLPESVGAVVEREKSLETLVEDTEDGRDCSLEELLGRATTQHRSGDDGLPLSPDRMVPFPMSTMLCPVCRHIVDRAVEAPCCHQMFCAECIFQWLGMSARCPNCRQELRGSLLVRVHIGLASALAELPVSCDFASSTHLGCRAVLPLQNLRLHVRSQCLFRPEAMRHDPLPKVISVSDSVGEVLAYSPSKLQNDVAGKLTHLLVHARQMGGSLDVGHRKPETWMKVTKGQTPSESASDRTLRLHEVNRAAAVAICGEQLLFHCPAC